MDDTSKVDKSIAHTYFTFGVVYEGEKHKGIKWKDFYNQYLEKGGDGFYACWKNPYLEPSLKIRNLALKNGILVYARMQKYFKRKLWCLKQIIKILI